MNQQTNSYSFPVLEDGKNDYNIDVRYEVTQIDGNSELIKLKHHIIGDSLLSSLLADNQAKFITISVLKSAMYRETYSNIEKVNDNVSFQNIPLLDTFETQSFSSSIVYIGEDKEFLLNSKDMGLNDFWDGITVKLQKGSILAKDGWRELENTASDLLSIRKSETIKYGFKVEVDELQGGKFIADMEKGLFDSIRQMSPNNDHKRSIMIHVLSVGFMSLFRDYKDDDLILTNFRAIKQKLISKNMKTWNDSDFSPNEAACMFLEHKIKPEGIEND